ncbi:MAG: glycosyltransferase family 2 protein [Planctomycetales bacterium]|nr:glycosyltransferase family 2 protein [Planctomycetales bacterium]
MTVPSLSAPTKHGHLATDHISNGPLQQLDELQRLTEIAIDSYSSASCVPLSVVIPVYNEPKTVLAIVRQVRELPIEKQIIVVNDGSTDETRDNLATLDAYEDVLVIHHDRNQGKGAALRTGFAAAEGEIIIIQDADMEYRPTDILRVIKPLQANLCDVVYGSRYLGDSKQDPSRLHRFGNWFLTRFSNLLTGYRLTDMETCYKAFRREVIASISIEQSRFGFEPEITAKIAQRGMKILEVPVSYCSRSRADGKKIGFKDLINTLYCIVRYNVWNDNS